MYGFALSGFCQGIGSKMIGGDLLFFTISEVVKTNWFSVLILLFSLVSSILVSFILDKGSLNFLTNQQMNPYMISLHMLSANITITIGVVLSIVTIVMLKNRKRSNKIIAKKVGISFLSGMIITFGTGACGLSHRTLVFNSLTPGPYWDPVLLVYLTTYIATSILLHLLVSA